MYCPQCGKPNEDNVQFCAHCGATLAEESSPVEEPSPAEASSVAEEPSQEYAHVHDEMEPTYSATADDDFKMPESRITHPLYVKIKGYIFYFIAACFLYTLFAVVSVEGRGSEGGDACSWSLTCRTTGDSRSCDCGIRKSEVPAGRTITRRWSGTS